MFYSEHLQEICYNLEKYFVSKGCWRKSQSLYETSIYC